MHAEIAESDNNKNGTEFSSRGGILRKNMTESVTTERVKPFLRWAGSKRQIIPVLTSYWDNSYNRYIEPFAGSAALFFNLAPSLALLGDVNKELIATYNEVKNNYFAVVAALKPMKKGRKTYLKLRSINPAELSPAMRAARFIYLNRFCFNGIYRTNRAGRFNVPYGGDKAGKLPSRDLLSQCSACLQTVDFHAGGFEKTLERAKRGDFVYLDPPYSVKSRRVFNEYDASIFDEKHLKILREWLHKLDKQGVAFLVSYALSREGYYLSKGFHCKVVCVRRNIAGFAAKRRRANELLISNVDHK